MKKTKRFLALLLALMMALSLAACGDGSSGESGSPSGSSSPSPSGSDSPDESGSPAPTGEGVIAPIAPDAAGVAAKWSEEKTSDGWYKVTNEGGETLGYSKDSGVQIIQVDGFAFKDLDRDGMLDGYEDWRNSDEDRAHDLAAQLTAEEMIALYTHGGWSSFGSSIDPSGDDYAYVQAGGRGGVTRSAGSQGNTSMAIQWVNALQTLCESTGNWGIPATISIDPNNMSNTIDQMSLGSTFDPDLAFELGQEVAKMWRAVGVTMLLGPQTDLATTPILARASGDYTEDPALNRDLVDAYISGLQSTWSDSGEDLGWGEDSVYSIVKHYAGAGAAEGSGNDHFSGGAFDVFPGNNYEAHLIGYYDAAFNLTRSVTKASGVMPNYASSYSTDGSLGEVTGGAYSEYKIQMLLNTGYQGFILTDWQITSDGGAGSYFVEDLTVGERFAKLMKNGIHQVGGTIAQSDGTKKTVYVPYMFNSGAATSSSAEATPPSWEPVFALTAVGEYFNVVTDTVGDPTGTDDDGNAIYTENDIIRASASELAACDMALVGISSPITETSQADDGTWLPASLQFEAYTAKTARQESIGGFVTTETMNDGYGTVSQDVKENRSYYNQSVGKASNYSEYELLQYTASAVPDSCKVVLLVEGKNPMVFSGVEPLSDAILLYWGQGMSSGWFKTEVLMGIVAGETEPSGLLNMQMPANMETVEAQYEDVPRDMDCYVDADGNAYDFTFGLNWSGKIDDERVQTYNVPALTECENLDFFYAN